jgi:hypothetical protein
MMASTNKSLARLNKSLGRIQATKGRHTPPRPDGIGIFWTRNTEFQIVDKQLVVTDIPEVEPDEKDALTCTLMVTRMKGELR